MAEDIYVIHNDRIKLRKWLITDITSLSRYANNKKIHDYVRDAFPLPYTEKHARDWINFSSEQLPLTDFAVEYNGEAIGAVGIRVLKDIYRKNAEIGYWIGEPFWGQGIATEAVKLLTYYVFNNFPLMRLYAGVIEGNVRSIKVLEKAGYKQEAVFKNSIFKNHTYHNECIYSILREEVTG